MVNKDSFLSLRFSAWIPIFVDCTDCRELEDNAFLYNFYFLSVLCARYANQMHHLAQSRAKWTHAHIYVGPHLWFHNEKKNWLKEYTY